jgi:dipeptidyl aminopeptidase/acylaminoacyl peptidase
VSVTVAPFGSWASPFPIETLTDGVVFLSDARGRDGIRWWLEGRPSEGGRQVLVRRDPDGSTTRLTPPGFNARSRVHEYGGAATLVSGGLVVVSSFTDGRLYRVVRPEALEPITPERAWRFADFVHDASRNRLISIRESHEPDVVKAHGEWVNDLVAIDLASGAVTVLAEGADFYAAPRLSPDGTSLVWVEWRHPNMPWDGTELKQVTVAPDGSLGQPVTVAGSRHDWISQPRWSPAGVLHFAAEPGGWMNLYRQVGGQAEAVAPDEAEFALPEWQFGNASYGFLPDGDIVAVARSDGRDQLRRIHADGSTEPIDLPFTEIQSVSVDGERLVLRVAGPAWPARIIDANLDGGFEVLRQATPFVPEAEDVSFSQHIDFPSAGGRTAHANFYPPTNRSFVGPAGELPPLIVTSHGGPTSEAFSGFATGIQLFASRGYAVVDVDYGGSTGYGKAYRKLLEGQWGVVDVEDCVAAATWLVDQGLVDGLRLAIRGGSASGFTTLAALAFTDTFSAGTSLYGLGDLRAFVKDTHKFESRYLESLIGPWPEAKQLYHDRSPALHAGQITSPVLVEQGAEDRVVPPAEAERIVDALEERHIPYAFLLFPGEDHGFRGRDAIIRAFSAELSFYAQVFGFEPADELEPVRINHLDRASEAG